MGRSCTLIIPGDVNNLSPNRRYHWRTRAEKEAVWKLAARDAWNNAGSPFVGDRVRITFYVYRKRLLDPGNAFRSLALTAVENGLKGRAFPDDSARYLEYGTPHQETTRESAYVIVLIEEIEEKSPM